MFRRRGTIGIWREVERPDCRTGAGWKLVVGAAVALFAVAGKALGRLFGRKPSA
jgi:hypothetical protein